MTDSRSSAASIPDQQNSSLQVSRDYLISEIVVQGLFGRHSYRISPLDERQAKRGAPPLMLLYGGNGSGKTTILRLLWHLFSPSGTSGHRTYIQAIPFEKISVLLGNGDRVEVAKESGLIGPMTITVKHRSRSIVESRYPRAGRLREQFDLWEQERRRLIARGERVRFPNSDELERIGRDVAEDEYVAYLEKMKTVPILLADDRRMHFDYNDALRRQRRQGSAREDSDDIQDEDSQLAVELGQTMARTVEWLRQNVITGAAAGSEKVDDLYRQVLLQLSRAEDTSSSTTASQLRNQLVGLENRASKFSEFGIFPRFEAEQYVKILKGVRGNRLGAISSVLGPYISAQEARLDKLQSLEETLRSFVDSVNRYLVEKSVTFTLQRGIRIHSMEGDKLTSKQLSSGERQLLLLLCNTLLARSSTGLFFIDEPELSLNARWQRTIVRSLLECAKGSSVQFLMATHSVEIITRHRAYLAVLEERAVK